MKIVSLVPSLTELLFDLQLDESIRGRTRFCVHPAGKISEVPIVGGTKNPNIEKILAIKPDLIIANREENRREDVEQLRRFSDVHVTGIATIEQALNSILDIGRITDRASSAERLVSEIKAKIINNTSLKRISAVYLIWKSPYMSIGNDTYIHDVMKQWSLKNLFEGRIRYPETSVDEIRNLRPDVILLSSEPYPFSDKHVEKFSGIFPSSQIKLVNGEWFSWYGSRMNTVFPLLTDWRRKLEQNL